MATPKAAFVLVHGRLTRTQSLVTDYSDARSPGAMRVLTRSSRRRQIRYPEVLLAVRPFTRRVAADPSPDCALRRTSAQLLSSLLKEAHRLATATSSMV